VPARVGRPNVAGQRRPANAHPERRPPRAWRQFRGRRRWADGSPGQGGLSGYGSGAPDRPAMRRRPAPRGCPDVWVAGELLRRVV